MSIGERFPTDAEIAATFGVSRTVVREAVSALRAEGLLTTQQGRGSVVASRVPSHPFGITHEEIGSLADVIKVYELRRALEGEAAGLAALRRTEKDVERLTDCIGRLDAAIERGEDAIQEDIDLHVLIAKATQNEYFPRLLESFSSMFIARRRIRADLVEPRALRKYLDKVQDQHRLIVGAIIGNDSALAKRLMRKHLDGSRYKVLMEKGALPSG